MSFNLPLISIDEPPPSVRLPNNFPNGVATPKLLDGVRVKWKSLSDTAQIDTGVVIGRCYLFAHHQNEWAWKYLVFLHWDSYSRRFCTADAAWEQDLEPLD
jgi:hypothetical protein